jgi:hypothetical protein
MTECEKGNSHINSNFIRSISISISCISSNNNRHPVTKNFTPLHYTSLHLSTLHFCPFKHPPTLHYTSLHLSTLHFFLFKLPPTKLHYTSLHLSTLHFFPFKLPQTTLQYTSQTAHLAEPHLKFLPLHFIPHHYTSPQVTSLLDDFRHTPIPFASPRLSLLS